MSRDLVSSQSVKASRTEQGVKSSREQNPGTKPKTAKRRDSWMITRWDTHHCSPLPSTWRILANDRKHLCRESDRQLPPDQEPNRYAKAKDIGDGRACFQYSRSRAANSSRVSTSKSSGRIARKSACTRSIVAFDSTLTIPTLISLALGKRRKKVESLVIRLLPQQRRRHRA